MTETHAWVCAVTGAARVVEAQAVQSLWSGYGAIERLRLEGGERPTVILKRVEPPSSAAHPRGWATRRSHARKLRSYDVETEFYRAYAARCPDAARVPACLAAERHEGGWRLLLEDLDAAGFGGRRRAARAAEVERCLDWLAALHARFLGEAPEGLWPEGSYWHLATRPDELAVMREGALRDAAEALDAALASARHRTLIHGDAKLANFCFSSAGPVAAVDFQYVGGGAGVRDVAYLLSCLPERELERRAEAYLDHYFDALRPQLGPGVDAEALEAEWRALYPVAWADFERFLAGWAPEHEKRTGYARRMTDRALASL